MNWKEYEKEIGDYFKLVYPHSDITHNSKIDGRYSKVERQIDILIEDYVAGNRIRIIVDGKFFSKKIDVKMVEEFIGMLDDCEAHKGLLITTEGYSLAALNRAYFSPTTEIELDILNFKDLYEFQSICAIPYTGSTGFLILSPFGWVIDGTRRPETLATLYQRGLTFEEARNSSEFMYININNKNKEINTLDKLIQIQDDKINKFYNTPEMSYLPTIKRNDINIKLRCLKIPFTNTIEYTGFLEFEELILFIVLHTPEILSKRNKRKLETLMLTAQPIGINHETKNNG